MAASNNRHYSEEEIQAIFRRAAKRQEASGATDSHRGLTLDELKAIGAESGIDPAHVEAAASDIERGIPVAEPLSGLEKFYGEHAAIHAERVLPGAMDDATWAEAVEVLRAIFNTRGQVEEVGAIREWSAFTSSGFDYQALMKDDTWYTMLEGLNLTSNKTRSPVHVEAKPTRDGTRITASYEMPLSRLWEAPGFLGGFWLAALVMSIVYLFASLPPTFLLAPLVFFLVGGGLGAYQRYEHQVELRTTRQRIQKALDRIEHLQAADAPTSSAEQSQQSEAARVSETPSLDWEPEDEAPASAPSSQRQRDRS